MAWPRFAATFDVGRWLPRAWRPLKILIATPVGSSVRVMMPGHDKRDCAGSMHKDSGHRPTSNRRSFVFHQCTLLLFTDEWWLRDCVSCRYASQIWGLVFLLLGLGLVCTEVNFLVFPSLFLLLNCFCFALPICCVVFLTPQQ